MSIYSSAIQQTLFAEFKNTESEKGQSMISLLENGNLPSKSQTVFGQLEAATYSLTAIIRAL